MKNKYDDEDSAALFFKQKIKYLLETEKGIKLSSEELEEYSNQALITLKLK